MGKLQRAGSILKGSFMAGAKMGYSSICLILKLSAGGGGTGKDGAPQIKYDSPPHLGIAENSGN